MLYQARDGYLYRRWEQRSFPPSESPDPERARWIDLCWHDPAAARKEREAQRLAYWRARAEHLRLLAELEPLPVETEPKRRGPKITCTCGSCPRCKARESMRRRRAAAKAAEGAIV